MTKKAWAVETLMDVIKALPDEKYIYARLQLGDAVESILQADKATETQQGVRQAAEQLH